MYSVPHLKFLSTTHLYTGTPGFVASQCTTGLTSILSCDSRSSDWSVIMSLGEYPADFAYSCAVCEELAEGVICINPSDNISPLPET